MPSARPTPSAATRARVARAAGDLGAAAVQQMETDHEWYRSLSAEDRSWVGLVAQAGHHLVPRLVRRRPGPARRHRRRVRHGATRADPLDLPGADPRPDPHGHQRRRARDRRPRRPRRGRPGPRGGAALQPRGRLLGGRGLRPGRRGPRRVGRPAGVARRRRRRCAARPTSRCSRGPPPSAGARSPRSWWWSAPPRPAPPPRCSATCTARPGAPASSCSSRSTGRGSSASAAASPTRWRWRRPSTRTSATGRSWWARSCRTCSPPAAAPGPRSPGTARRRPGRRHPARCTPTTCSPSGPCSATCRPAARSSRGSCGRSAESPGGTLLDTAAAFLDGAHGVEGTARALIVHPNTVRYRLAGITKTIGYDLTDAHDAQTVRIALAFRRLGPASRSTTRP